MQAYAHVNVILQFHPNSKCFFQNNEYPLEAYLKNALIIKSIPLFSIINIFCIAIIEGQYQLKNAIKGKCLEQVQLPVGTSLEVLAWGYEC